MSLIYKGEIEEDSKFAVMIFTTELENDIDVSQRSINPVNDTGQ